MADTIFKYPLDLEGTSINNKVIGEAHTIGSRKGRLFIADYGPFFGNTAVITDMGTGKPLKPKTDYRLIHAYAEAERRAGQAVYVGVQIVNPDVSVNLTLDAQMVGGEFSYSTFAIQQALTALQNDERPIQWGEIIGLPSEFVPAPHMHDAYDLYGMKYVVEAMADVSAALREGDQASRNLLIEQIRAKFTALDDFCMQFADCFASGAAELRAIQ